MWVAWREGTLTRAEELEALCEWVTAAKDAQAKGPQKDDQVLANAIRRHLRVTAKAKDQQAKESQKDDQVLANAIRRHLKAARQAARAEALESTRRFVLVRRIFRNGPLIERAMSNLDAAEAQLLNLAPAKYILGQMPCLLRHVQCHLPPADPARQEFERIARGLASMVRITHCPRTPTVKPWKIRKTRSRQSAAKS